MPLLTLRHFSCLVPLLAGPALANTVGGAPLIPEPMVFDMIRPLAAPRGELEANTLALFPLAAPGQEIDWAPEVEYAFMDGHAIELELPFENGRLTGIKLGLQGSFGTLANKRIVHGWQYLGVVDRDNGKLASTLLYIMGVRYSPRWSTLTMIGINRPGRPQDPTLPRDTAMLVNHSLFHEFNAHTTTGLEINLRTSSKQTSWLLMPQMHQRLNHHLMLQVGAGWQKPAQSGRHPVLSLRVIREF
jgi:hypothetical protein